MIKLITGAKGTGKTKIIINMANDNVDTAKGDIVFLTDTDRYMYSLRYQVRVINTECLKRAGQSAVDERELVGFIRGILAGNHDIESFYIDGAHRIGDDAYTDGATFTVDLTKVSLGATTLVFEDSRGRTIAKYVQVVEHGKVDPGYIFNTSMFVDFAFDEDDLTLGADVDPDKLLVLVSINDVDWVDGTDPALGAKEYTQSRFLLSDSGTKSMGLSYIQGHRYRVTASLWTYTNDYETDMHPDLAEVTGSKLFLFDYVAGGGNSVKKDDDGTSWLTIVGYSGTVTLTIDAE